MNAQGNFYNTVNWFRFSKYWSVTEAAQLIYFWSISVKASNQSWISDKKRKKRDFFQECWEVFTSSGWKCLGSPPAGLVVDQVVVLALFGDWRDRLQHRLEIGPFPSLTEHALLSTAENFSSLWLLAPERLGSTNQVERPAWLQLLLSAAACLGCSLLNIDGHLLLHSSVLTPRCNGEVSPLWCSVAPGV